MTDYRITRFFCGSNERGFTAVGTEEHRGLGLPLCNPVSSVVRILSLSPELDGYPSPCGHVRAGGGRLLPGNTAANGIELQADVLG